MCGRSASADGVGGWGCVALIGDGPPLTRNPRLALVAVDETRIRSVLDRFAARTDVGAVSFAMSMPKSGWSMVYESREPALPYFIGSVTKLYTAAIIMQLRQEGSLRLDDRIVEFLDPDLVSGIHVYRETDYSEQITVRQLLSHTSGLANYLMQARDDGGSVFGDALDRDRGWTFVQALGVARSLRPAFPPGMTRRAHFSHTNYALLGHLIEQITGTPWEAAVMERVVGPLSLTETWPFSISDIDRYDGVSPVLHGQRSPRLPLTMASVRAQGCMVSTAEEGLVFLRAFLQGDLFDPRDLGEMTGEWRRLTFPTHAGMGILRHTVPRLAARGGPREFLGHPSSTGAVLYHAPREDLYISGTINQMQNAEVSRRLLAQLSAAAGSGRHRE